MADDRGAIVSELRIDLKKLYYPLFFCSSSSLKSSARVELSCPASALFCSTPRIDQACKLISCLNKYHRSRVQSCWDNLERKKVKVEEKGANPYKMRRITPTHIPFSGEDM